MLRRTIAVASTIAIALAVWQIALAEIGLTVVRQHIGTTPLTVFGPSAAKPVPVVVICHGFAGSQQMMQPFAVTIARNGYLAVTFDFPGHARNTTPLPGGMNDHEASGRALLASLDEVVAFARSLPGSDGRVVLLGHSMASDTVVRYARNHPTVMATIAVSMFSRDVTATSPRNLLVIDGALKPSFLRDEGFRVVSMAAGKPAEERVTYGSFADGTARRIVLAAGAEHISVLYARDSMVEAVAWLNGVTGQKETGFSDRRGPWLGLLYLGIVALAAIARDRGDPRGPHAADPLAVADRISAHPAGRLPGAAFRTLWSSDLCRPSCRQVPATARSDRTGRSQTVRRRGLGGVRVLRRGDRCADRLVRDQLPANVGPTSPRSRHVLRNTAVLRCG